jgi:coenzyme F420-0:L-glutamate ligase/coenzyme F420-1:gamma-L-glutamate ligase
VVTSKIVSLAERRTVDTKGDKNLKKKIIEKESDVSVKTKLVYLSIKDGMFMTSAGIDESNGEGKLILLPKDSYAIAKKLRLALMKKRKLKNLGVLITDSRCLPLRAGAVGLAIGYSGFKGIRDYRGTPDLFGRAFTFSRADVADGLAGAAVLLMGEGAERQPLAVVEDAPVVFSNTLDRKELLIDPEEDMYRPLFARLLKKRKK